MMLPKRWRLALALSGLLFCGAQVFASPPPKPATPLLEQLDRESRALYGHLQGSIVRVQMPTPRWLVEMTAEQNPLQKWRNLDPAVRRRLEEKGFGGAAAESPAGATTRPATDGSPTTAPSRDNGWMIVMPPASVGENGHGLLGSRPRNENTPRDAGFVPNYIGVCLDDRGHVLVPLYIERDLFKDDIIPLTGADGKVIEAKFIGSDRPTNMTILRAASAVGGPAQMREGVPPSQRPAAGSLLMYLAFHNGAGRLGVWSGQSQELGLAFEISGQWAGIGRYGQFLSASACKVIAAQLIQEGKVSRSTIGVWVSDAPGDDPQLRRQLTAAGRGAGLTVEKVSPGTPAEACGLRPRDILLALGDDPVDDVPNLAVVLVLHQGPTDALILRGGELHHIPVNLRR